MAYAKTLLFTVLVPGTVVVLVPHAIRAAAGDAPAEFVWRVLALGPAIAGLAIYCWCALDFARAAGTPAPIDPPKKLVVRGLYRLFAQSHVRRRALAGRSPGSLLRLCLALRSTRRCSSRPSMSFVVFYEEPTLARSFGATYRHYCATVPRWLPGLRPPPCDADGAANR